MMDQYVPIGFEVMVRYVFGTAGGKLNIKLPFLIKQWFTEQIALPFNKFTYN